MVLVNYPVSNRKRYRKVRSRAAKVRNNKKKSCQSWKSCSSCTIGGKHEPPGIAHNADFFLNFISWIQRVLFEHRISRSAKISRFARNDNR